MLAPPPAGPAAGDIRHKMGQGGVRPNPPEEEEEFERHANW
jgi:hypothetical protein